MKRGTEDWRTRETHQTYHDHYLGRYSLAVNTLVDKEHEYMIFLFLVVDTKYIDG